MKKILFLSLTALAIITIFTVDNSHAYVLLNFEPPQVSRDNSSGDYNHTVSTPYGDIHFNGRVYYRLNSVDVPDHTLGTTQGSFLKNTQSGVNLTMTFDFDVQAIDGWTVVYKNFTATGYAYDSGDNLLGTITFSPYSNSGSLWKTWQNNANVSGFSSPIRKLVITPSSANDIFGIDDIKIFPAPEPASLSLLGLGLLGAVGAGLKRRK